jgi:hypothetical protein
MNGLMMSTGSGRRPLTSSKRIVSTGPAMGRVGLDKEDDTARAEEDSGRTTGCEEAAVDTADATDAEKAGCRLDGAGSGLCPPLPTASHLEIALTPPATADAMDPQVLAAPRKETRWVITLGVDDDEAKLLQEGRAAVGAAEDGAAATGTAG